MMNRPFLWLTSAVLFFSTISATAEINVVIEHHDEDEATADFSFRNVPPPDRSGGAQGKFTIVSGEEDGNSGGLAVLNDGQTPQKADEPDENFFFAAGTPGGRLQLDLHSNTPIQQITSYSWHRGSRAAQVYKLYGATNSADWKLICEVDTRAQGRSGQFGVNITNSTGPIGTFRYLRFDCSATETDDAFGNTFYSEINVLPVGGHSVGSTNHAPPPKPFVVHSPDGKSEITIDYAKAPELADWVTNTAAPVLAEWYQKIVALLPSDGYEAPAKVRIILKPGRGVGATVGTRVTANSKWLGHQLHGEALGSLIHELVHVVQNYGSRHSNPGYFVEGLADYIRWYQYEPQSKGTEIKGRGLDTANYNKSYRVTAHFLNWVTTNYDKDIVPQLNAAMREGRYDKEIWTARTKKTVEQLNDEWKAGLRKSAGVDHQ